MGRKRQITTEQEEIDDLMLENAPEIEMPDPNAPYTYVKYNIPGFYIEFPKKLKEEEFDNLGTTYEDFLDNKWVLLSEEQLKFHEENPYVSVKEVLNMELEEIPTLVKPEKTLYSAKVEVVNAINSYDSSEEVNQFTINGETTAWFTPQERANYKNSVDSAKILGVDTLSLFIENTLFEVSTKQAEEILAYIQLYADKCFMVTQQHKINVMALETIEEVEAYDYKSGYPEKLNFNLA